MRFETISNTDLLNYALLGMRQAQEEPMDEEDAYLLEEQIIEIEETLEEMSKGAGSIESVKRLRIGEKFGSWYYQKFNDEEYDIFGYTLYDSSGEYVNEFNSISDMKTYIRRLYSRKR